LVNLETLAFWKRKDSNPEPKRIVPLPPLQNSAQIRPISEEEVAKARNALKVLLLEKQILGSAITTIFESESKGIITDVERDLLVEKYKIDLKRLEKSVDQYQRIVDLHDLEYSRAELVKDYKTRMADIEAKIENLKPTNQRKQSYQPQIMPVSRVTPTERKVPMAPLAPMAKVSQVSNVTLPVPHNDAAEITDAEKRIEQIRTEILQAMDRLEQIETEG